MNKELRNIIKGKNNKFILIIGPCSIHNIKCCKILINIINKFKIKFKKKILLIFRIHGEKPRSVNGWKGIIYDPNINNTYNIKKGIEIIKKLLKLCYSKQLLVSAEIINDNIFKIINKYINIGVIGARNCSSQIYREISNYYKKIIGYKNDTNGNVYNAINSIESINNKNNFIKIKNNKIKIKKTNKIKNKFIILRGGKKPNYNINHNLKLIELLKNKNIGIIIDCNHDNSKKNYKNQIKVTKYIINNLNKYNKLLGIMLEVNINNSNQKIKKHINKYISITDQCISIRECYLLIKNLYNKI